MKILLFSGSHNRHLFVHRAVLDHFEICGVVAMKREEERMLTPEGLTEQDQKNFIHHFETRYKIEQREFGEIDPKELFNGLPVHWTDGNSLNTAETADFVKKCQADMVFIFGVDLILDPVLSLLPKDKINLHLGLSPGYRGSATLFWPFYNLEPQYAGATLHQIVPEADAGAVIHQVVPELKMGDGIHDVGVRTVHAAVKDLILLLEKRELRGYFPEYPQKSTGRLYLTKAFKPEHLRVMYDLYDNKLVDCYLKGELSKHQPKIIRSEFLENESSLSH